jgi:hypothetical protein
VTFYILDTTDRVAVKGGGKKGCGEFFPHDGRVLNG